MQPLCAPPATASEDGEGGSGVRPPGSGSAVAGARLGPLQTASRGPPPPENGGSSGARGQPLEDCRREDESCATVLPTGAGKALASRFKRTASRRIALMHKGKIVMRAPARSTETLRRLRRQRQGATAPARKRVKRTHRVDGHAVVNSYKHTGECLTLRKI